MVLERSEALRQLVAMQKSDTIVTAEALDFVAGVLRVVGSEAVRLAGESTLCDAILVRVQL
jgi:hypothetical protein